VQQQGVNMADKQHSEITIIIDKEEHKSPNPTTGAELYKLGGVDPVGYDLYRETHGKGDDELINNDDKPVTLKDGDHFFSSPKKITPGA
jgi:hypothetical protein